MKLEDIKHNKLSYSIRFLLLIYLIPMLAVCYVSGFLNWFFCNINKVVIFLFKSPMDKINKIFPLRIKK